jgi:hypothetical protein
LKQEPVPKLIDYALSRMVLGQAFAVFQAFSLAKLQNLRLLSQKLKFWESLTIQKLSSRGEIVVAAAKQGEL